MDCHTSGKTFFSLKEFKNCAPVSQASSSGFSLSKKCCDFSSITVKVEHASNVLYSVVKVKVIAVIALLKDFPQTIYLNRKNNIKESFNHPYYLISSIPLFILIQVFRL